MENLLTMGESGGEYTTLIDHNNIIITITRLKTCSRVIINDI